MRGSKWNRWSLLLGVIVGCNAKLSVDPGAGGAGGPNAGSAGKLDGSAGKLDGSAGKLDGSAGKLDGSAGKLDRPSGGNSGAGEAPVDSAGSAGVFGGGAPGAGGAFGYAGAPFPPPPPLRPGELGQPCVPGETIDSSSGVAAAKITTLDRCWPGLSCSSAGKCAAIPKCPKATGECVEYETPGSGGSGGANGFGGAAGSGFPGAGSPGTGPITTPEESGVTAMAIDSSRLYWIEYGRRDSIGNYQNDGALMTMKLADGTTAQLGATLAGPNALAVTSSHAYVVVDGAGLVGTISHPKLVRLSLVDGASQVIQEGTPPIVQVPLTSFAAAGDTMYWSATSTFFSLGSSGTTPVAGASYAANLHADSTNLYFTNDGNQMVRTSLAGGGAVETLALDTRPFDLNGDSIYGLESVQSGMILTKAAKSNPSWLRIRALGEQYPARLVFVGDRLFAEWADSSNNTGLTTTILGSTAPPVRMLDPLEGAVKAWVGTSSRVYWTDGPRIYSRPIPTP